MERRTRGTSVGAACAVVLALAQPLMAQEADQTSAWSDELGETKRTLALESIIYCLIEPCPNFWLVDAEGGRFAVDRLMLADDASRGRYTRVEHQLSACGARVTGVFRAGRVMGEQQLFDLVVDGLIPGPDPACE